MSRIDFGGAVIPAMAGFFLFGKRAKVQEIQEINPGQLPAVIKSEEAKELTGVARYLLAAPVVSSVSKYVKKSEKQQLSGVAKYVLRQTIAERNAPKPTGVSQYVTKVTKDNVPARKSSVDRYISKQEWAIKNQPPLTGVAKYEANQDLIARKKAALELVKKYREAEAKAEQLAKEAAVEAAYEATKSMITEEKAVLEGAGAMSTRVGRYLHQMQDSNKSAKATGVARYLAKQIIIESQKPKLSKVAKYLQEQNLSTSKKPSLTGVAKYLSKQASLPQIESRVIKEKVPVTKVSQYIATQEQLESDKPKLSGVARYLQIQAKLDGEKKVPTQQVQNEAVAEVEICLEGEFIPANEYVSSKPTGVSKYLEKQGTVVVVAKEVAKDRMTGVSRYLEKQVETVKENIAIAPLTGVDKYLLSRAS